MFVGSQHLTSSLGLHFIMSSIALLIMLLFWEVILYFRSIKNRKMRG